MYMGTCITGPKKQQLDLDCSHTSNEHPSSHNVSFHCFSGSVTCAALHLTPRGLGSRAGVVGAWSRRWIWSVLLLLPETSNCADTHLLSFAWLSLNLRLGAKLTSGVVVSADKIVLGQFVRAPVKKHQIKIRGQQDWNSSNLPTYGSCRHGRQYPGLNAAKEASPSLLSFDNRRCTQKPSGQS